MSDFFEVDLSGMDLDGLIRELDNLDKSATTEIMPEVMQAVGQELLNEEKRIINGKSPQFADKLSVMQEHSGKVWRVKAGYSSQVIADNIEVLITEFGRPGKRGRKNGGRDSLGRKIGVIQPYPHIRAAYITKKEKCLQLAEKLFMERIDKEWQKN